jgi:hypothetical protein
MNKNFFKKVKISIDNDYASCYNFGCNYTALDNKAVS